MHDGINFHRLAPVIHITRSVPTSQSVAVASHEGNATRARRCFLLFTTFLCTHKEHFVFVRLFQSSQIFPDWLSTSCTTPHQAYSVCHWPRMCIESEAMQTSKWGLSQMGLVRYVNRSTNFAWTVM